MKKKVCEGMSLRAKVNLQPINPDKSLVNLIVNAKKCQLSVNFKIKAFFLRFASMAHS